MNPFALKSRKSKLSKLQEFQSIEDNTNRQNASIIDSRNTGFQKPINNRKSNQMLFKDDDGDEDDGESFFNVKNGVYEDEEIIDEKQDQIMSSNIINSLSTLDRKSRLDEMISHTKLERAKQFALKEWVDGEKEEIDNLFNRVSNIEYKSTSFSDISGNSTLLNFSKMNRNANTKMMVAGDRSKSRLEREYDRSQIVEKRMKQESEGEEVEYDSDVENEIYIDEDKNRITNEENTLTNKRNDLNINTLDISTNDTLTSENDESISMLYKCLYSFCKIKIFEIKPETKFQEVLYKNTSDPMKLLEIQAFITSTIGITEEQNIALFFENEIINSNSTLSPSSIARLLFLSVCILYKFQGRHPIISPLLLISESVSFDSAFLKEDLVLIRQVICEIRKNCPQRLGCVNFPQIQKDSLNWLNNINGFTSWFSPLKNAINHDKNTTLLKNHKNPTFINNDKNLTKNEPSQSLRPILCRPTGIPTFEPRKKKTLRDEDDEKNRLLRATKKMKKATMNSIALSAQIDISKQAMAQMAKENELKLKMKRSVSVHQENILNYKKLKSEAGTRRDDRVKKKRVSRLGGNHT